jgi:choline dehydrogenase
VAIHSGRQGKKRHPESSFTLASEGKALASATSSFSYIIIGAGSAGCVMAARLSEDPDAQILVLESGPMDRSLYMLRMPAALAKPLESQRYNWDYQSEPEPFLDGRRLSYPRGRVVGGSSSINGMVYLRGNPRDYDRWAEEFGLSEWSYAHCLPYFKKMETSAHGPSEFRGASGPIRVTIPPAQNPLHRAFLEAGQQAGYAYTSDVNGYRQEGFFLMENSTWKGLRSSASRSYLHPARRRGNIKLRTRTDVVRILFERKRAVGVEYLEHGKLRQARASEEVILSAGSINSPKILMLSGVGPAEELAHNDLPVVADLPGVGMNLQDHLDYLIQYECTQPVSLYPATKPIGQALVGLQWLLLRSGVGASNIWETGSFFRSQQTVPYPNLQHHFAPVAISYDGSERINGHGFQVHLSQMRPRSRGWVKLRNGDPLAPPRILFNHLQDADDRQEIRDGVRLTREVIDQRAFDPYRGAEIAPGPDAVSDDALDAYGRAKAETSHHPSCTCRMGFDRMAVVDPEGRVHGLDRLRIVDASIMPNIVSSNINAPTIMIAEKIADRVRGKPPLPGEKVETFSSQNYGNTQLQPQKERT